MSHSMEEQRAERKAQVCLCLTELKVWSKNDRRRSWGADQDGRRVQELTLEPQGSRELLMDFSY